MVAASKGAADDFLRATGKAWMGVHVFTLTQLAAALASADLGARAMTPMSHLSLEALTARVIHEERRREALAYFEPVADTPGFVRALAATLGELRMESADAAALAASGEPGRDLARLLTAFGDQLARQALADRAAIYRAAAGVESHRLLGLPTLILDVPLRHELERSVLRNVVLRAPEAAAFVISADEEAVAAYEAEAAPPTSGDGLLERMRRYLFATELAANPAVDDGSLQFFSTPGEGLECVEIARRLQHLAKAGTRFDGIAIVLRNPEKYQPLLEEALRRAGVPAYFNRGTARPDAAGRAFLALLSCAAGGLSASRFAEYLSLAQVPPLSPEGAAMRVERAYAASADEVLTSFQPADEESTPPVSGATSLATPAGWERLIVDAAVIGGRDRWARRLDGLLNELKNQLKTAEDGAAAGMERRLNQLTALRSFALPLIAQLGELPREAPWSEWIDKLTALAETALRHPEAVLATLNELRPMADVGPASLDEVFGVLRERLRFLRNDPPARRYGQVFVCTPEEIRGRAFEYVFLPGLAEGLFPRRAFEDPLLLDTYRARLGGLAMKDDRVARERLLLKLAAAAASKFGLNREFCQQVAGKSANAVNKLSNSAEQHGYKS